MDFWSYRETGRRVSGYGGAIYRNAAGNRHELTKARRNRLGRVQRDRCLIVANAATCGFAAGVVASVLFGGAAVWELHRVATIPATHYFDFSWHGARGINKQKRKGQTNEVQNVHNEDVRRESRNQYRQGLLCP